MLSDVRVGLDCTSPDCAGYDCTNLDLGGSLATLYKAFFVIALFVVALLGLPSTAWAAGSAAGSGAASGAGSASGVTADSGTAPASGATGTLAVAATSQNSGATYRAYQLFDASVGEDADGNEAASDIAWASDAAKAAVQSAAKELGYEGTFQTAQDAADWFFSSQKDGTSQEVATKLAQALQELSASGEANDLDVKTLTVSGDSKTGSGGASATVATGYWLVVSDDSQLGEGQSGTAPILVLVGTSGASVTPKGGAPTVNKHVLEDSTNTWQKTADATVGDELYWRLEATVPAGLTAYTSYSVTFEDTLAPGLDAPDESAVSVQFHCGLDGDWSSDDGWTDLSGCTVHSEGTSLSVATPDLVAAVQNAGAKFADGVQVRVVYSAPLNAQANHGSAQGNPNKVRLDYPASPASSQRGKTPWAIATAYTWDVLLQKQSSADGSALPGAVLSITDDRGRHLTGEGLWVWGDATVTTDSNGQVTIRGVDSGVLSVSETKAPEGYDAFSGSRDLTITTNISEQQAEGDKVTMKVSAQSPLKALVAEPESGQATVAVENTPTPGGPGSSTSTTPTPKKAAELLQKMGDPTTYAFATLAVGAGIAAVVASRKLRKGSGQ